MKKDKLNKILLLLIVILTIGCIIYVYNIYFKNNNSNNKKQIDIIEGYNYKLYDSHPDNYKKLFEELKKVLSKSEVDEEEYVSIISQMFIIDFYTLDSKNTGNDIGGTDFVYKKVLDKFKDKAKDTTYLYLENEINKDEELPVVKDVVVEKISTTRYTYLNTADNNCYVVNVSINYEKDLGYEKAATLYFVHEDNKLSLVEIA